MPRGTPPTNSGNGKAYPKVSPSHRLTSLEMARAGNQLTNMLVSGIVDQMATTFSGRSDLAKRLGYQYQGDRDVYTALGYTKELIYADYLGKYRRGDIARRIVKAPVQETWKKLPTVNEVMPEEERVPGERTPFEMTWDEMAADKRLKLWHQLRKGDLVSGIGRWGALFLGFDDADSRESFATPVDSSPGRKLLYMTPMTEEQVQITTVSSDPSDPRFGQVEYYQLLFQSLNSAAAVGRIMAPGKSMADQTIRVHWSRVLHIAEETGGDGVIGTPRLEAIYNRLMDLDRIVGGTGEAFWRNAFPGLQFKLDPEFETTDKQDLSELKTQVDNFVHNWERYIRTRGITIQQLDTNIADPKGSFSVVLSAIAGTTGIPQRILIGSERGELSSNQDQAQWAEQIQERRQSHVEPVILDELILRLVDTGVLPSADRGWAYSWPDLHTPSEKDKAEVAVKRTEALAKYSDSLNAGDNLPLSVFLRSDKFLGFSEEEAQQIERENEAAQAEEASQLALEAERIAQEGVLPNA